MNKALTIAGSDCSGGAGIQADLKTFTAFGVYGASVITAIVAENTIGVQAVHDLPVSIIEEQLKSVLDDVGADAVKIGMLSNPDVVELVSKYFRKYDLKNVVVDPVMVAKSGDALLNDEARVVVRDVMLPLAKVITPNLPEAEVMLGTKIDSLEGMKDAALRLRESGCEIVVVKGGHLAGENAATDVIFDGREYHTVSSPFFDTPNTHGTGCTFSSAIAAGLAKGIAPLDAIKRAKQYISSAIENSVPIGHGHGPTNHLTGVRSEW